MQQQIYLPVQGRRRWAGTRLPTRTTRLPKNDKDSNPNSTVVRSATVAVRAYRSFKVKGCLHRGATGFKEVSHVSSSVPCILVRLFWSFRHCAFLRTRSKSCSQNGSTRSSVFSPSPRKKTVNMGPLLARGPTGLFRSGAARPLCRGWIYLWLHTTKPQASSMYSPYGNSNTWRQPRNVA